MQAAEGRVTAGRWSDAITIWAALCDAIIDIGQLPYDEEGDLDVMLAEIEAGLSRALESYTGLPPGHQIPVTQRAELIQRVVDLYILDHNHHDLIVSVDTSAVLVANLMPIEIDQLDAWLRSQIIKGPVEDSFSTDWHNLTVVSLIVALKAVGGASDQDVIEEYLAIELWPAATFMLLHQKRYDEAVALARRRIENQVVFLQVADEIAIAPGKHRQQAVDFVEERFWETEGKDKHVDERFQEWLARQYAFRGKPQDVMKMHRQRFSA